MRTLTNVLLLWCLPLAVSAQQSGCPPPDPESRTGAVLGKVSDRQTGVALGFVRLLLQEEGPNNPLEERSSSAGGFQFCAVPEGTYRLSGQLGDWMGSVGGVRVTPGAAISVSLELGPPTTGPATGTLSGVVVDRASGDPIEEATLTLDELGLTTLSNPLGHFVFPSLPPGPATLRVRHLGHADAEGPVEIEAGKATQIQVALVTEAIALDPIVVTAVRRRVQLPDLEDFERRYYSGWGRFVLEEEIGRRSPTRLTDVLHETGLEITGNGGSVMVRRTMCAPLVYLDGVKLTRLSRGGRNPRGLKPTGGIYPWGDPDASPEQEAAYAVNLVHPSEVVAVEVYRGPAETPGQYIDSNSRCGVILIWTRRGNFGGEDAR